MAEQHRINQLFNQPSLLENLHHIVITHYCFDLTFDDWIPIQNTENQADSDGLVEEAAVDELFDSL